MKPTRTVAQRIQQFLEAGGTGTVSSICAELSADKAQVGRELQRLIVKGHAYVIRMEAVHGAAKPVRVFGSPSLHTTPVSIVSHALASRPPLEQAWFQRCA